MHCFTNTYKFMNVVDTVLDAYPSFLSKQEQHFLFVGIYNAHDYQ